MLLSNFQPEDVVSSTEELLLAVFQLQLGDVPPPGEFQMIVFLYHLNYVKVYLQ